MLKQTVGDMVVELNLEISELEKLPMTMQRLQAAERVLVHAVKTVTALATLVIVGEENQPLEHGDFIQPLEFKGDDLEPHNG